LHLKAKLVDPAYEYVFYSDLNLGIRVANANEPLCNEVKKRGFLIDQGHPIELRPKDELIVYVSMGGFEK
jgi:hypothetical protein